MTEHKSIERRRPDPEGLDFEGLKQEGIRLLQDLCGKSWTDYNLHDPGVTILEQLCYALTDLRYRTEFETADYLTGADGTINFDHQALYRPHDIFPSEPTTPNDYRKLLIDAMPEIHNVWVRPKSGEEAQTKGASPSGARAPAPGLYRAHVNLPSSLHEPERAGTRGQIIEQVARVYAANRNLCEDLEEVQIVQPRYCDLHARIEIEGKRDPAEILGELYFRCSNYIAPGITYHSFEEMRREGKSLEEIFTGPLTRHGYIDEGDLDHTRHSATISELVAIVRAIEGVKDVQDMWFVTQDGQQKTKSLAYDPSFQTIPWLRFPVRDEDIGIRLYKADRQYAISSRALGVEFARRQAEYRALRTSGQDPAAAYALPRGEPRHLHAYYSIQNHFPAIYGINRYGVPDSEPPKRKAQARQLKAYLLLFEQIMANFLQSLEQIPRLFSRDETVEQSYFHQVLSNTQVPDVERLYKGDLSSVDSTIAQIVKGYDNFFDRRGRILDYLLGLYGEQFTQRSLRQFNYYYTERQLHHELIRNRIRLLRHIVELSRQRGGAFNYREAAWNTTNCAGLKKKVGILLGLKYFDATRSLTDVFVEKGLEIISDEQFARVREGTVRVDFVDLGDIDARTNQPFQRITADTPIAKDDAGLFEEIIFLKNNLLGESILRNGIDRARYRVGSMGEGKRFQLALRPEETTRWYYLSDYRTQAEAEASANDLIRLLIRLNVESEGLHLVEHILLRPVTGTVHGIRVPDDFYPFRLSVLFPSWTARFHNPEFRKLAEETVRLNCPAHVYPEFYWLDFPKMREFERLYMTWLEEKRGNAGRAQAVNAAAQDLIAFLLRAGGEGKGAAPAPGQPRASGPLGAGPQPPAVTQSPPITQSPGKRRIVIRLGKTKPPQEGGLPPGNG